MNKLLQITKLVFYFIMIDTALCRDDSELRTPSEKIDSHPAIIQITESVFSGATPDKELGFSTLKRLGVKTIISVDGASPEVKLASSLGMEYIHIPVGYDTITVQQSATLTSVLSKKKGPFYIHCHHGHHRGPAAAAVMLIRNKLITKSEALSFVDKAGLSPHYKGLWKAIENAPSQINDSTSPAPLVSKATVSDYTQAMVEIDTAYQELRLFSKNNWQPLSDAPDLSALHSSLMLLEKLKELPRTTTEEFSQDKVYQNHLAASTEISTQLHQSLQKASFEKATTRFKILKDSCIDCHSDYRD